MLLGSDIIWLPRVEAKLQQHGAKAYAKCLTPAEHQYCQAATSPQQQAQRLAVRLAAKEAVAKALGVGLNGFGYQQGLRWHWVEVQPASESQGPRIALNPQAQAIATAKGVTQWRLSLSHDGPVALATVLGF